MDIRIKQQLSRSEVKLRIQNKLSKFFQIAEVESSRSGKVGMEVGSFREKILIAMLIYIFGEENVDCEIPITEPEVDVRVFETSISIKTKTGSTTSGFKLSWTVDSKSAIIFRENYTPSCEILFVHIHWGAEGGLYYIPLSAQLEVLNKIGASEYIKIPKMGTNPRGIEISKVGLKQLLLHKGTLRIPIQWQREEMEANIYNKWVKLWQQD